MNLTQKKVPGMRWFTIIPILIFANFVQWVDKSVISYALPGGMLKDLGMNSSMAGLLGTVFSIGYLFLQVPGGSLAAKGKCKKFLACTMVTWTVILFLLGACTTPKQALVLRFLLGFFEGAVYPSLISLVANWFPNEERGRAMGIFLSSASISQIIIGPTASMILLGHTWRTLFHFGAIVSGVLVVVWVLFLKERPQDAKWLSEEEKNYLVNKLESEKGNKKATEKAPILEVLKDKNVWKFCFMAFCQSFGSLGFAFWLPTMIKTITKTGMTQTGFLAVIPNIAVFIGVISIGFISDKTQKRRLLGGISPVLFTGFLVLAMVAKDYNLWLAFGMLCAAGLFLQGSPANLWAMVPRLLIPEKAGAARGVINTCANASGLISPLFIGLMQDLTGSMLMAWIGIFGVTILGFLVSLTLPKFLNEPIKVSESAGETA